MDKNNYLLNQSCPHAVFIILTAHIWLRGVLFVLNYTRNSSHLQKFSQKNTK